MVSSSNPVPLPFFSPGSGSGLVVCWEQETGLLLASGDSRVIRVWDTQREMRMQVICSDSSIGDSKFLAIENRYHS